MANLTPETVIDAAEARRMEEYITSVYSQRREYMTEYQERLVVLDEFMDGKWVIEFPDGRKVVDKPKTENRALRKLEDTGNLAGNMLPTIMVESTNERDYNPAQKRERILRGYWQNSEVGLLLPRMFMDAIGCGMFAMHVWPDFSKPKDKRFPIFKRLDPRTVLPPLNYAIGGGTELQDLIVHKIQKFRVLARSYPEKMAQLQTMAERRTKGATTRGGSKIIVNTEDIQVIEYWGDDHIYKLAMLQNYPDDYVVLESEYNRTERCPAVMGFRPTWGTKIRGSIEGMLPILTAENRMLTYALMVGDKIAFSPTLATGDIKNLEDHGPGAILEGEQGADMKTISPPTLPPSLFNMMATLAEASRQEGNHPAARSGQVGQSIGSASFVESLMGGLTTEVQSLQEIMRVSLVKANEIAMEQDQIWCDSRKAIPGLPKELYLPTDDIKSVINTVTYGAGAGLDKFNAFIRMDQAQRGGYVSRRWVRENMDGLPDVPRIENEIIDEAELMAFLEFALGAARQGDPEPLKQFHAARQENKSPLSMIPNLTATAPPEEGAPPAPGGPGGPMPTAEGEALSLEKGGLPGAGMPAVPGQPPAGLPPLSQLGIG